VIYGFGPKLALDAKPEWGFMPMENCLVKCAMSGVIGAGAGGLFGLFMGSFDSTHGHDFHNQNMTTKEQLKQSFRQLGQKSVSFAKNFGLVGLIYSGVECNIEKGRAKHDIYNSLGAGCITGGALAARGGPHAALLGCGGFALFSGAIDLYMDRE